MKPLKNIAVSLLLLGSLTSISHANFTTEGGDSFSSATNNSASENIKKGLTEKGRTPKQAHKNLLDLIAHINEFPSKYDIEELERRYGSGGKYTSWWIKQETGGDSAVRFSMKYNLANAEWALQYTLDHKADYSEEDFKSSIESAKKEIAKVKDNIAKAQQGLIPSRFGGWIPIGTPDIPTGGISDKDVAEVTTPFDDILGLEQPSQTYADDNFGCKALLCFAGGRGVSECVPTIKKVLRGLARGKGFPICTSSHTNVSPFIKYEAFEEDVSTGFICPDGKTKHYRRYGNADKGYTFICRKVIVKVPKDIAADKEHWEQEYYFD